jgi:hypothetical protein
MVQRFISKIFGMDNWEREAQILKNTIGDDEPPPGEVPGEPPTPQSQQPAPGWQTQVEKGDEPVAH